MSQDRLQDSLTSRIDVYAGGSGLVPIPDMPADDFIPTDDDDGLLDDNLMPVEPAPQPEPDAEVEPQPEPEPEPQPEPEPEPEPEPQPEPDAQVDEPRSKEPPVRNKQDFLHRLGVKNAKLAQRDARIAELEAQLAAGGQPASTQPAPQTQQAPAIALPDLAERRQRVLDLTIDGKTGEAAALQAEIDQDLIQAAVAATTRQVLETVNTTRETQTFNEALADIAVTYPELDETGDSYDTKTARMVNAVMAEYMDNDYPRVEALKLATDEVMRLKYPSYFTQPAAAPAPAPTPAAAPAKAAAVKSQVARAAAAAVSQPGIPAGANSARVVASTPIDVFGMSDTEFSSLTPEKMAELRGDYL